MEPETDPAMPLVFTRYLYPKEMVMHSLFLSILDKNVEEALFWGYELYYSGYQQYVFDFLLQIYETIYLSMNKQCVTDYVRELYEKTEDDSVLGILIMTISTRPYSIGKFIEDNFNVKCSSNVEQHDANAKQENRFLKIKSFDPTNYWTIELSETNGELNKGYRILRCACEYMLKTQYKDLFKTTEYDFLDCLRNHWLYYAFDCPLWNQRILEYGGRKCDVKRDVVFDDENKAEEFYNRYNLEPDEQSLEIQHRCVGNPDIKQLSIKDFSKQYGGNIVLKIKKKISLSLSV
uniref:Uncharacterized protein n=1 Tax=viral metagenome TaxID=1070528 RepID=A0A6C0DSF2_9ZZZZ